MKEWFTPSEVAALALPALPATLRGINMIAKREGWLERRNVAGTSLARKRQGRGGGWEYHYSLFPTMAQTRLVAESVTAARKEKAGGVDVAPKGRGEMWDWFERQPDTRKGKAHDRLAMLEAVTALQRGGLQKDVAVHEVARTNDVGKSAIYSWFDLVAGVDRADWLPYLAPRFAGRTASVECADEAWQFIKTDYLRQSQPSFSTCYERLQLAANEHGWTIPSERTLARRIAREIPKPVFVFLREGPDALKRLYPAQERDRTMFHALEAVNVDGHKWDVFVKWPDGTVSRPIMVGIQDLYSNKILGWRIDKTENVDLIRLAFADVFNEFGIPDVCYMDNGRGFAAKLITGGTPNRYRFKVKEEEPTGVLISLGVEVHWTLPYSGQSKPIERAWKSLCDSVAKHPAFEGAYTGNKPDAKPENYGSKAVPLDTFIAVVGQGIALHNARAGRRTRVCAGVKSFDQAFNDSYAKSIIRKATEEQLRMCFLAVENVRPDNTNGSVRVAGNRYWSELLLEHMGKPLSVRFDPDDLQAGIHLYRLDGVYLGFAECVEAIGFADTQAAREHARKRNAFKKAVKIAAELERQLSTEDMLRLLPEVDDAPVPKTKLTRLVTVGNLAAKASPDEIADAAASATEFERNFQAGLQLLQGGREE
ncbi:MAG: transposase domain-containing protein [Parvibaculum sedimenti]|uniref:transposase domain-containing protein n=1 Tax=Parvibaculum sedimenti TaxID=2608632 RepID=UPI003BB64A84